MAKIDSNTIVTYEGLKEYVLEKISYNCCNIDKKPDIPADINPNSTKVLGGSYPQDQFLYITFVDNSGVIKTVSSSTVESQFEDFLEQRGLKNKPNIPISSKAMLNLFNNIAIFLSCRSKIYRSASTGDVFIFYDDSKSITYDTAPFEFKTDLDTMTKEASPGQVSQEEARQSVKSLICQINKTNKIAAAQLKIRCVCSSSSSCSSSSCSCSCCSSSSSSFIVYMLI